MKRLAIAVTLLGTVTGLAFAGNWVIQVDLPRSDRPARAEVALFGRGLCMQSVPASHSAIQVDVDKLASSCNFGHDFRPITEVKILVVADGHAIAPLQVREGSISRFRPTMRQLPRAIVKGWVDPPPSVPLKLSFHYSLLEAMPYFGYMDGSVPLLALGTTTTDASGAFTIDLPDLTADTFIDQERSVDVSLAPPENPESNPPLAEWQLPIRELYTGSSIILRPDRDWPPHPSLQQTTPAHPP